MRASGEGKALTCEECRRLLESYLTRVLSASQDQAVQQHLAGCLSCFDAAFTRARERVETGEEPLREPPSLRAGLAKRVVAFVRAVLTPDSFPMIYSYAPAIAGALDDESHLYTTADRRFLVEVTPLPSTPGEHDPTVEIAIRAHDPRLRGSMVSYRVQLPSGETIRSGETSLDAEGVAVVQTTVPRTDQPPYRLEVEAFLPDAEQGG